MLTLLSRIKGIPHNIWKVRLKLILVFFVVIVCLFVFVLLVSLGCKRESFAIFMLLGINCYLVDGQAC